MVNTPHVLVVEDDRETRDLVARYLSGRGFRVSSAKNGPEMRQSLETGNFSLILLDLMLPGEDGLVLCRELRAGKSANHPADMYRAHCNVRCNCYGDFQYVFASSAGSY